MSFKSIRLHLQEYLAMHGITTKMTNCLNPDHDDSTASMRVYEDHVHCFGCKAHYDIFDVATILEGLPTRDSGDFIEGNVRVLAQRFGVTLGQQLISKTAEIYAWIANKWITDKTHEDLGASFKDVPKLQDFPLRVRLPDSHKIRQALLEKFDISDVNSAWIHSTIFPGEAHDIYPFWSDKGVVVGWNTRQTDPDGSKYIHTPNNQAFCKKEYLYGMHLDPKITEEVWLVEGQKDAIACWAMGKQGLSIQGSTITEEQVTLLVEKGFRKIVLALDNDRAGEEGVKRSLRVFFGRGIQPLVYKWRTKDAWDDLEAGFHIYETSLKTAIDFFVSSSLSEDVDHVMLADEVFQILGTIPSSIKRKPLLEAFAEALGFDKKSFCEDFDLYLETKNSAASQKASKLIESLYLKTQKSQTGILESAKAVLEEVQTFFVKKTRAGLTNDFFMDLLGDLESGTGNISEQDIHFRERGLKTLSDMLHEDGTGWTQGFLCYVGGDPHTGKTALLDQITAETLLQDPNSMVIHFSTDDETRLHIPRILSSMVGHPSWKIFHAVIDLEKLDIDAETKRKLSFTKERLLGKMRQWGHEERLVMKDANFSKSFADFSYLVKHLRDKYPERKVVTIVDNIYNCTDFQGGDEGFGRMISLSNDAKSLAVTERCSVWSAAQNRKNGFEQQISFSKMKSINDIPEPHAKDLKGASALEFDASAIIMLANEYIYRGKDYSKCVWVHRHEDQYLPRIKLKVEKNKISGSTGPLYFNLYPKSSYFRPVDSLEAIHEAKERFKQLRSKDEDSHDDW